MLTARAVNSGRKVCGILPTGWAATGAKGMPSVLVGEGGAGAGDEGRERGDSVEDEFFFRDGDEPAVIRAVPYSLHAPYEELESIVRSLAPVSVVGNTRPPKSPDAPAIDPENFFGRLLSDPPDDDGRRRRVPRRRRVRHERGRRRRRVRGRERKQRSGSQDRGRVDLRRRYDAGGQETRVRPRSDPPR